MTTINWEALQQQAEEASRPLPDGPYPCEVEKATSLTSSNGNPMIKMEVRVYDGPGTGRKLFSQITLTKDNPTAMMMFFRGLAAFGIDSAVLAEQPSMEDLAAMLVGRKVTANINTTVYQGVDRNNIKNWAAPTGVIQAPPQRPLGTSGLASAPLGGGLAGVPPIGTPALGVPTGVISVVPTVAQTQAVTSEVPASPAMPVTTPVTPEVPVTVSDAPPVTMDKSAIPSF